LREVNDEADHRRDPSEGHISYGMMLGNPKVSSDAFWYEAEEQLLREGSSELGELPPGMTDNLQV
jgi:hypothetical protein